MKVKHILLLLAGIILIASQFILGYFGYCISDGYLYNGYDSIPTIYCEAQTLFIVLGLNTIVYAIVLILGKKDSKLRKTITYIVWTVYLAPVAAFAVMTLIGAYVQIVTNH